VLRALEERGIRPAVFAGTSIGALLASAYVGGIPLGEMVERARRFGRRDLFRLNRARLLLDRMGAESFYLADPLRALCEAVCPPLRFDQLRAPLLVNTVDLERGTQVVWGLPGLQDVPVADAVYASCALPGFFPPGRVDGRTCADGGTVDNLPVPIAAMGMDSVIAVDVGSSDLLHHSDIHSEGFASIYMRAATMMMKRLQQYPLERWQGPPMVLVRPRIQHVGWFDFGRTDELVAEGYRAANEALERGEADPSTLHTFICECGDEACMTSLQLTHEEYEGVRSEPHLFALAQGHEGVGDSVLEEFEHFALVEKVGRAREIAHRRAQGRSE
jgi:NTE family protein